MTNCTIINEQNKKYFKKTISRPKNKGFIKAAGACFLKKENEDVSK
jgi:hypothetical protein